MKRSQFLLFIARFCVHFPTSLSYFHVEADVELKLIQAETFSLDSKRTEISTPSTLKFSIKQMSH
jgi:hypothetical protein